MEKKFENIKQFFCKELGIEKTKLDRTTRIYKDLRVDGDDAFDLLNRFGKEFNVDMKEFPYSEYFSPEGIDLIGAIITFFKDNKTPLKELTLGDLEKVVSLEKWPTRASAGSSEKKSRS